MWPNSLVPALLLAPVMAGCDGVAVGNRTQRSGEVKVASNDMTSNNSSEPLEGLGAPKAWRVSDGAAFYGAADQPSDFALRCDRAAQQIVFERAGAGPTLSLSAGGTGASLGTRAVGKGRVLARTGIDDAVVAAMARSQSMISVSGGAETLSIPGGVAVRRVIDFCRRPAAEPAAPAAAPDAMTPAEEPAPPAGPQL